MANPKRKHSKSRRDKRRSHQSLISPSLATCPQCHEMKPPHRVCPHCGYYKGVEAIEVKGE